MPVSKRYRISLYRAERGHLDGLVSVIFDGKWPSHVVQCSGLPALLAEADRIAAEHAKPCSIGISCLDKPVPPGFNKATSGSMFRNLDNCPECGGRDQPGPHQPSCSRAAARAVEALLKIALEQSDARRPLQHTPAAPDENSPL